MEEFICPRCKKLFTGFPAYSHRDNTTKICSDCGTLEALEDFITSNTKKEDTNHER